MRYRKLSRASTAATLEEREFVHFDRESTRPTAECQSRASRITVQHPAARTARGVRINLREVCAVRVGCSAELAVMFQDVVP